MPSTIFKPTEEFVPGDVVIWQGTPRTVAEVVNKSADWGHYRETVPNVYWVRFEDDEPTKGHSVYAGSRFAVRVPDPTDPSTYFKRATELVPGDIIVWDEYGDRHGDLAVLTFADFNDIDMDGTYSEVSVDVSPVEDITVGTLSFNRSDLVLCRIPTRRLTKTEAERRIRAAIKAARDGSNLVRSNDRVEIGVRNIPVASDTLPAEPFADLDDLADFTSINDRGWDRAGHGQLVWDGIVIHIYFSSTGMNGELLDTITVWTGNGDGPVVVG